MEQAWVQLDGLRRAGRFCDAVLVAEGRKFPAHRLVLCACSPYFDRMFQPGFVEQENKEIQLQDFDAETLSTLLDYIYTSSITITEENVQDILIGGSTSVKRKFFTIPTHRQCPIQYSKSGI